MTLKTYIASKDFVAKEPYEITEIRACGVGFRLANPIEVPKGAFVMFDTSDPGNLTITLTTAKASPDCTISASKEPS